MIKTEFLIFEGLTIVLFLACVWHASRQGRFRVWELFFSLLYGVLLEWMTLQQLEAYHYGQFVIMFDGAPLSIGLGWAVIIYSGMEFVKNLEMPTYARPFLVGFLALNLDLAMDAIAIRLGFWNWIIPIDSQWFGVPWGNFWAWYIVVVSFSGLLYLFRAWGWQIDQSGLKRWGYVPLALLGSVLMVGLTNYLYATVFIRTELMGAFSMVILFWLGIVMVFSARPAIIPARRLDWVVFLVPLGFHLYFNIVGFVNGYYAQLPILAVIGLLMLATGLAVHAYPAYLKCTS